MSNYSIHDHFLEHSINEYIFFLFQNYLQYKWYFIHHFLKTYSEINAMNTNQENRQFFYQGVIMTTTLIEINII